jgi:pseudaminic acid biosynthesis-associated methylase
MSTPQIERWKGEFGRAYTDRNALDVQSLDDLCVANYGVTRTSLNTEFLATLPRTGGILEVGCNMGNQLLLLEEMGFRNLFGIEIQTYALDRARERLKWSRLKEASAFAIPFPDREFDVVFTSGVLIHIAPSDLTRALGEIYRCSGRFIWGFEYFAEAPTSVDYRGHNELLWKMNYPELYLRQFPDLELVKSKMLPYLQNGNVDCMFLLQKKSALG